MKFATTVVALAALLMLLAEMTMPVRSEPSPEMPGLVKQLCAEIGKRRALEEAYLSLALTTAGEEGTSLALDGCVNAETTHPRAPLLGMLFGNAPAIRVIPLRGAPAPIRVDATNWMPLGAIHSGWSARATTSTEKNTPPGLYLVARSGGRTALLRVAPDASGLPSWSVETTIAGAALGPRTSGPAAWAGFPSGNDVARVVLRSGKRMVTFELTLQMLLL